MSHSDSEPTTKVRELYCNVSRTIMKESVRNKNIRTIEIITKVKICNKKDKCRIRQEIVNLTNKTYCN